MAIISKPYLFLRKEKIFKSYIKISTDVKKGEKPIILDKLGEGSVDIFN